MRAPAVDDPLTTHEEEAVAYGRAHLAAIAFIEQHLCDSLDLEHIARSAGYSASEFSRRFTRLQGESVMAYVRGRRLETAAERILADPDARLIDVAIECGFDSQAAFTRAFVRAFGEAPGRLRKRGVSSPPLRRRRTRAGTPMPVFEERIERLPQIQLAGLRMRFSPATYLEMAGLWERLVALRQAAGYSRRDESFGVFLDRAQGGVFEFFAATRAWPEAVGAPVEFLVLPAGRYLVLRHRLHEGLLLPQLTAAQELFRELRQPTHPAAWDFQHYPANFGLQARWIDHYVPLEPPPALKA